MPYSLLLVSGRIKPLFCLSCPSLSPQSYKPNSKYILSLNCFSQQVYKNFKFYNCVVMYNVDHSLSIPIYGYMGHYKFSYENDFYKVCHINIFIYEHICL